MDFKDKYTITLSPNKLAYYQNHQNNDVFKQIHVGFVLEGNKLYQVSGGSPLDRYNKVDIDKVIGEDGYLERLHDAEIYHGDIIAGVWDKENNKYQDLKINVGNILKDEEGKIKLIDFGPINENEKRPHVELMEIEKKMLKQVRKEGVKKTYSPKRIKPGQLSYKERQEKRKRDKENDDDDMFGYYSDDSDDSYGSIPSPPKKQKSSVVKGDLFAKFDGMGGKKKRRRTKKRRRRKRKYTRRKKKRKRRRTKKKRRRRR